mmetsp:Transcript_17126/g.24206  ORF Transcript_17126/g.24206 Transcript_17126/m.24206 type:complete len:533 (+) Transcript_17126:22-1620(+)
MSSPVIVQGEIVNTNAQTAAQPNVTTPEYSKTLEYGGDIPEVSKGELQPRKFNDPVWAFLFLAQVVVIAVLAGVNGPKVAETMMGGRRLTDSNMIYSDSSNNHNDMNSVSRILTTMIASTSNSFSSSTNTERELNEDEYEVDPAHVINVVVCSSIIGFIFSGLSLTFMMSFAELLIKAGLYFNIFSGIFLAIVGLMLPDVFTALLGFMFAAFAAYYAYSVWNRIPFAAANLVTAVSAVKENIGVTLYAYISIVFMILWMTLWTFSTSATIFVISNCNAAGECQNEVNGFVVFLFLVSLFWTFEVIKNIVHVTVSGTVGTWWWQPESASSCCSSAVRDSFFRSITYSFGSICLGSLLVAIIKALKQMVHRARESDDGILRCLAECILGCIESILEYFNEWAYVYVALYGYSFVDAAKNVINLFQERGWTTIITDGMIGTVLTMISLGVGILTGIFAVMISSILQYNLEVPAFFLGFILGAFLTSLLMGVVGSAVNTVIVCYAEDPKAFETYHSDLSYRMRDAWRQAWPAEFKY